MVEFADADGVSIPTERDLDTLLSQLVKLRDHFTCQKCGKPLEYLPENCEAAHIIGKKATPTRWLSGNVLTLCKFPCHRGWAHERPRDFEVWVRKMISDDKYDSLVRLAAKIQLRTPQFMEDTKRRLEQELASLKGGRVLNG